MLFLFLLVLLFVFIVIVLVVVEGFENDTNKEEESLAPDVATLEENSFIFFFIILDISILATTFSFCVFFIGCFADICGLIWIVFLEGFLIVWKLLLFIVLLTWRFPVDCLFLFFIFGLKENVDGIGLLEVCPMEVCFFSSFFNFIIFAFCPFPLLELYFVLL